MYKATAEAVSGIRVKADGKWLTCIGNKPVRVGDRVWTDGRCVYGNHNVSQQSFVFTPPQTDDLILPICHEVPARKLNTLEFQSYWRQNNFLGSHSRQNVDLEYSDVHFRLVAGGSPTNNQFALVRTPLVPDQHNIFDTYKIADATITTNGDIYAVADFKVGYWDYNDDIHHPPAKPFFKDLAIVYDPVDVIIDFFLDFLPGAIEVSSSGYMDADTGGNDSDWWSFAYYEILSFPYACVDYVGNFFSIAFVGYDEGLTPPIEIDTEKQPEYKGIEWGNTGRSGTVVLHIKNQQVTIMNQVQSIWYAFDPFNQNHDPKVQEAIENDLDTIIISRERIVPYEPYTHYLPLKNDGRGGYYSFDCHINTVDKDFKGVKFFDSDLTLLCELTIDDFLAADDVQKFDIENLDDLKSGLPVFDLCQLSRNDFLILLRKDASYIFRCKRKKLSLVYYSENNLPCLYSVNATKKQYWRRISSSFEEQLNRFYNQPYEHKFAPEYFFFRA